MKMYEATPENKAINLYYWTEDKKELIHCWETIESSLFSEKTVLDAVAATGLIEDNQKMVIQAFFEDSALGEEAIFEDTIINHIVTFDLCLTEKGTYFIESNNSRQWAYHRTDSCDTILECVKIFNDCVDFESHCNNWCSGQPYDSAPYKSILSFKDISEVEEFMETYNG